MKKVITLVGVATLFCISSAFVLSKSKTKLSKEFREKYRFISTDKSGHGETDSFFIQYTEVTNGEYLEFYNAVKAKNDAALLAIITPDPNGWKNFDPELSALDDTYFTNEIYRDYPVVNVTNDAAKAYCSWLTQKNINERPEQGYVPNFRLPEKHEWNIAAENGIHGAVYAWGGPSIKNNQGCSLCNFKEVGEQAIHFDETTNSYIIEESKVGIICCKGTSLTVTVPVLSYSESTYGLYNMNGNVAEMSSVPGEALGGSWNSTGYDVRNESVMTFRGSSPLVGFRTVVTFMKPQV